MIRIYDIHFKYSLYYNHIRRYKNNTDTSTVTPLLLTLLFQRTTHRPTCYSINALLQTRYCYIIRTHSADGTPDTDYTMGCLHRLDMCLPTPFLGILHFRLIVIIG